jgi:hypothetical protein
MLSVFQTNILPNHGSQEPAVQFLLTLLKPHIRRSYKMKMIFSRTILPFWVMLRINLEACLSLATKDKI